MFCFIYKSGLPEWLYRHADILKELFKSWGPYKVLQIIQYGASKRYGSSSLKVSHHMVLSLSTIV